MTITIKVTTPDGKVFAGIAYHYHDNIDYIHIENEDGTHFILNQNIQVEFINLLTN